MYTIFDCDGSEFIAGEENIAMAMGAARQSAQDFNGETFTVRDRDGRTIYTAGHSAETRARDNVRPAMVERFVEASTEFRVCSPQGSTGPHRWRDDEELRFFSSCGRLTIQTRGTYGPAKRPAYAIARLGETQVRALMAACQAWLDGDE